MVLFKITKLHNFKYGNKNTHSNNDFQLIIENVDWLLTFRTVLKFNINKLIQNIYMIMLDSTKRILSKLKVTSGEMGKMGKAVT